MHAAADRIASRTVGVRSFVVACEKMTIDNTSTVLLT